MKFDSKVTFYVPPVISVTASKSLRLFDSRCDKKTGVRNHSDTFKHTIP